MDRCLRRSFKFRVLRCAPANYVEVDDSPYSNSPPGAHTSRTGANSAQRSGKRVYELRGARRGPRLDSSGGERPIA